MAASDLPIRIRAESWLVVPIAAFVVASGMVTVETLTDSAGAAGWLAVAGAVAIGVVGFLFSHRAAVSLETNANASADANLPAETTPIQSLGVANWITVLRGLAYACAAGFVGLIPAESGALSPIFRIGTFDGPTVLLWGPAVLYGGGALLDLVDGVVARRVGTTTVLGERLDLGYDTLGFVVAPAVGVAWGRLPAVYLALSGARYCYRFGIAVEQSRGRTIHSLPPSTLRRPLAAGQMLFLSFALVPAIPATLTRTVAPFVLAPSLVVFLRDYLSVTGRLPPWLSREKTVTPPDETVGEERVSDDRPKTHRGDD